MNIPEIRNKLYHGTLDKFVDIDLTRGKKCKDFGNGFYLAFKKSHSEKIVNRLKRIKKVSRGYIYTYDVNYNEYERLYKLGRVKYFAEANGEWLDFILTSRSKPYVWHNYDIVIGPTADDDTKIILNAYREGFYGEVGSNEAKMIAINFLHVENLSTQVFIATKTGLSILDIKNRKEEIV